MVLYHHFTKLTKEPEWGKAHPNKNLSTKFEEAVLLIIYVSRIMQYDKDNKRD